MRSAGFSATISSARNRASRSSSSRSPSSSASAATGVRTFQMPPTFSNVVSLPPRVITALSAVTKLARLRSRNLIGSARSFLDMNADSTTTVPAPSAWAKRSPSGLAGSTGAPIFRVFSTVLAPLPITSNRTVAIGWARPNFARSLPSMSAIRSARRPPRRSASSSAIGWSALALAGLVIDQLAASIDSSSSLPSMVRRIAWRSIGSNLKIPRSASSSRPLLRSRAVVTASTPTALPPSTRR